MNGKNATSLPMQIESMRQANIDTGGKFALKISYDLIFSSACQRRRQSPADHKQAFFGQRNPVDRLSPRDGGHPKY